MNDIRTPATQFQTGEIDNKSPGVGEITPKMLTEIAEKISVPLVIVFNLSIHEGIVPLEWKIAN